MSEESAVVQIDEQGRFLGIEGHDGAYMIHVIGTKPEQDVETEGVLCTWNEGRGVTKMPQHHHHASKTCSNCKTQAALTVKCPLCSKYIYCSNDCLSKDALHAPLCAEKEIIGNPHRNRLTGHTRRGHIRYGRRYGPWARFYGGGRYFRPQLYPWYRIWHRRIPRYIVYGRRFGQVKLPRLYMPASFESIDEELARLRAENEALRKREGREIMPDPANGRYVWVKPVA